MPTKRFLFKLLLAASWLAVAAPSPAGAEDWPQWRGPRRDGVWREQGIVERLPDGQLPRKWQAPIGAGYSGPTVAEGRVYVTDRVLEPESAERVYCFDEQSGEPVWTHVYPSAYTIGYQAGPRASVTIDEGRAYALGAMGRLTCLDAAGGKVLWERDLNADYKISGTRPEENRMPIWGLSAAPLVHHDVLIVIVGGAEGAGVVGFDKQTGRERWRALDERAQYSAPVLVEQAGRPVVICWTGDSVSGLDPADGTMHWRLPFTPSRMPIGVATPVVSGRRVFCTSFYDGSLLFELDDRSPKVRELWRIAGPDEQHTQALHSIISTPLFLGDYIYGVDSYGELRCLEAKTGKRVWEDLTATRKARWSTIHFVQQGERTWMLNEEGDLIIARLSPEGYEELSRARLIEPTTDQLPMRGGVVWAHPAFANQCVFARNDEQLVCASLAKE